MDEDNLVPGSDEYKKARRRRQNRESASRQRALKKEQFESIQEKLDLIHQAKDKMEQELKKLQAENQELRQAAMMNNKTSFVYVKIVVLLSLFTIIAVQQLMTSSPESFSMINAGIVGLIVIFITFKN